MPSWINNSKISFYFPLFNISESDDVNVQLLNPEQRKAFDIVRCHFVNNESEQLLLLLTGKAGTGKSFLIDRLRFLLQGKYIISALFGFAAYNVFGKTLHNFLKLSMRGK